MKSLKSCIWILMLFGLSFLAQATLVRPWSYKEMNGLADLVVIAKHTSTKVTDEKTILPNIAPDVNVVGLSTEMRIMLVIKGDQNLRMLVLHHYRTADPKTQLGRGFALISFEHAAPNESFLMFLKKEPDGRYAPVTGQTDPAIFSVLKLTGMADALN